MSTTSHSVARSHSKCLAARRARIKRVGILLKGWSRGEERDGRKVEKSEKGHLNSNKEKQVISPSLQPFFTIVCVCGMSAERGRKASQVLCVKRIFLVSILGHFTCVACLAVSSDAWDLFQNSPSECGCAAAAWRLFPAVESAMCSGNDTPMTFQRAMR